MARPNYGNLSVMDEHRLGDRVWRILGEEDRVGTITFFLGMRVFGKWWSWGMVGDVVFLPLVEWVGSRPLCNIRNAFEIQVGGGGILLAASWLTWRFLYCTGVALHCNWRTRVEAFTAREKKKPMAGAIDKFPYSVPSIVRTYTAPFLYIVVIGPRAVTL